MTTIVRALEEGGFVRREPDSKDARVVRVFTTRKGERVLQQGRRRRVERLAERLAQLDPDEIETVRRAAELVERGLAEAD